MICALKLITYLTKGNKLVVVVVRSLEEESKHATIHGFLRRCISTGNKFGDSKH